jgi:hypothetical protein
MFSKYSFEIASHFVLSRFSLHRFVSIISERNDLDKYPLLIIDIMY